MKTKKEIEKKSPQKYEREIVEIIQTSIAPDLTPNELKVYLGVCRRYKADPIMKDIVPIAFNTKKGRMLNFIISKNFCYKVAHNSKELNGISSKLIKEGKKIVGAVAICWRKGCEHPFETEVDFSEYYNEKNELWGRFPGAMIKKVAETIVLKMAFGIDMVSDVELEKNNFISVSDIEIPKVCFSVSNDGKIKKEILEVESVEKEKVL